MQSKAMERSSCVSLSPVSLVWVKVHPFAETKQTHHGLNLHRDAHQHKPAQRIQERRKRKWWVLTCPDFSMLMSSLGQFFETLNEKETHKIKFSPDLHEIIKCGWVQKLSNKLSCRSVVYYQTITVRSLCSDRNVKVELQYLLTRLANGWTWRDVPITMRRSQRGKSWKVYQKKKTKPKNNVYCY